MSDDTNDTNDANDRNTANDTAKRADFPMTRYEVAALATLSALGLFVLQGALIATFRTTEDVNKFRQLSENAELGLGRLSPERWAELRDRFGEIAAREFPGLTLFVVSRRDAGPDSTVQ